MTYQMKRQDPVNSGCMFLVAHVITIENERRQVETCAGIVYQYVPVGHTHGLTLCLLIS